ncbi:MAG: hypothetical protein LBG96_13670 [Tannerella sp.]|jgi:hypothetical protein|nr:hypothetical protein [Tannerella sp.]
MKKYIMKTTWLLSFLCLPLFLFSQGMQITNGPYIQRMSENEATIIWTTNNDAISWLELDPAGNDSFYATDLDITVDSRIDVRQKDMSRKTLHTHIINRKK